MKIFRVKSHAKAQIFGLVRFESDLGVLAGLASVLVPFAFFVLLWPSERLIALPTGLWLSLPEIRASEANFNSLVVTGLHYHTPKKPAF